MLLGRSGETAPERELGQSGNDTQLWMCLVVKVVLLPGKSHGRMSLVGYGPWGREELDTTE